jgi:hypothetical protein
VRPEGKLTPAEIAAVLWALRNFTEHGDAADCGNSKVRFDAMCRAQEKLEARWAAREALTGNETDSQQEAVKALVEACREASTLVALTLTEAGQKYVAERLNAALTQYEEATR